MKKNRLRINLSIYLYPVAPTFLATLVVFAGAESQDEVYMHVNTQLTDSIGAG